MSNEATAALSGRFRSAIPLRSWISLLPTGDNAAMTGTDKYQKYLRLLEARRLLLTEVSAAPTAGHRVGYESPSQFSREYSRMFGASPAADARRLRAAM